MIVRNGALTLWDCLRSVAEVCEEFIVVDTGSDDDSPGIARSFGAKVVHTTWRNDFSAARNCYLEHARCAWVLSLDADEVLGNVTKKELEQGLQRHPRTAFICTIRNYILEGDWSEPILPSKFVAAGVPGIHCLNTRTVRLFPRLSKVRYCYPVHESLLPSLFRERIRVRRCAIPIHHTAYLRGSQESKHKADFYRKLGERKITDFPGYFLGYLELGKLYLRDEEFLPATNMFRSAIRLCPACVEAYCYLAIALGRQGRSAECIELLQRTLRRFPKNIDVRYLLQKFAGTEQRSIGDAVPLPSR